MTMRMNKTILTSLIFSLVIAFFAVPAWADESGYALLIQQSPPGAGSVNLGAGVHKMEIGETVTLSATPKPGYRFVYWLGDVAASDASATTIQADSPKMVVAVFAREEFDEDVPGAGASDGLSGGGGGGGQRGYINPISSPAAVSGASGYYDPTYTYNFSGYPDNTENDNDFTTDIPVPGDGNKLPVPEGEEVPEPATLLLLGLGSTVLLRRKR